MYGLLQIHNCTILYNLSYILSIRWKYCWNPVTPERLRHKRLRTACLQSLHCPLTGGARASFSLRTLHILLRRFAILLWCPAITLVLGIVKKQHTYSWQFMGTIIPIMTLHQKWPTKGLWKFGDLSMLLRGGYPQGGLPIATPCNSGCLQLDARHGQTVPVIAMSLLGKGNL